MDELSFGSCLSLAALATILLSLLVSLALDGSKRPAQGSPRGRGTSPSSAASTTSPARPRTARCSAWRAGTAR